MEICRRRNIVSEIFCRNVPIGSFGKNFSSNRIYKLFQNFGSGTGFKILLKTSKTLVFMAPWPSPAALKTRVKYAPLCLIHRSFFQEGKEKFLGSSTLNYLVFNSMNLFIIHRRICFNVLATISVKIWSLIIINQTKERTKGEGEENAKGRGSTDGTEKKGPPGTCVYTYLPCCSFYLELFCLHSFSYFHEHNPQMSQIYTLKKESFFSRIFSFTIVMEFRNQN